MTYINNSRRNFLKGITATSVLSATAIPAIALTGVKNELDYPKSLASASLAPGLKNKPSPWGPGGDNVSGAALSNSMESSAVL